VREREKERERQRERERERERERDSMGVCADYITTTDLARRRRVLKVVGWTLRPFSKGTTAVKCPPHRTEAEAVKQFDQKGGLLLQKDLTRKENEGKIYIHST
jgi:hypothetical protein